MYTEQLQTVEVRQDPQEKARQRRMRGVLTEMSLRDENVLFAKTRGISQNNRGLGFLPAYQNRNSGEVALSRFWDGQLAPIHVLDGLPDAWVCGRDAEGHVTAARPEIVSGFARDNIFYTREEAIKAASH